MPLRPQCVPRDAYHGHMGRWPGASAARAPSSGDDGRSAARRKLTAPAPDATRGRSGGGEAAPGLERAQGARLLGGCRLCFTPRARASPPAGWSGGPPPTARACDAETSPSPSARHRDPGRLPPWPPQRRARGSSGGRLPARPPPGAWPAGPRPQRRSDPGGRSGAAGPAARGGGPSPTSSGPETARTEACGRASSHRRSRRSAPDTRSPVPPGAGRPAANGRARSWRARCGVVAQGRSAGIPASRPRARLVAHAAGPDRSRSTRAWPSRPAYPTTTPMWQVSPVPTVPVSGRATPAAGRPCVRTPVSSRTSPPGEAPSCGMRSVRTSARLALASPSARLRTSWTPDGVVSPHTSATCQRCFRAAARSKPCRSARARGRDCARTQAGASRRALSAREGRPPALGLAVAAVVAGQDRAVVVSRCRRVSSACDAFATKIPALKFCYHCSTSPRSRCLRARIHVGESSGGIPTYWSSPSGVAL
jgi:hypothetical protein